MLTYASVKPNKWEEIIEMLARAGVLLTILTVLTCVVLGLLAAIIGSSLTQLGSGPGGLWGVPVLLLGVSSLLGLPSTLSGIVDILRGRWRGVARLLVFVTPLAIAVYFFHVPHAFDPCALGIWAPRSTFGSIPLCEAWGGGWNIHARFHLFLHGIPTLAPVALYWTTLKKWYPQMVRI